MGTPHSLQKPDWEGKKEQQSRSSTWVLMVERDAGEPGAQEVRSRTQGRCRSRGRVGGPQVGVKLSLVCRMREGAGQAALRALTRAALFFPSAAGVQAQRSAPLGWLPPWVCLVAKTGRLEGLGRHF